MTSAVGAAEGAGLGDVDGAGTTGGRWCGYRMGRMVPVLHREDDAGTTG